MRRLDHLNLMADDVTPTRQFLQEQLGFRLRENILFEGGTVEVGAWLSVSALVHEIALMRDPTGSQGTSASHLLLVRHPPAPLRRRRDHA